MGFLSTWKCMWRDWGRWGPSLGPFLLFFSGQSQSSLVSWPPHPLFFRWSFSLCPQGSVVPPNPPPWLLCAQSWGPPQKCRLSLSMHFPCSKQAGGQQGLSRLSDRGAERPRGKVFSHSAVRRSSAPLKCSHLAAPSSETV